MSAINESIVRQYFYSVPERISKDAAQKYEEVCKSHLWPLLSDVAHMFHSIGKPLYIVGFRRVVKNEIEFDDAAHLVNARGYPLFELEFQKRIESKSRFELRTPYVQLKRRGEKYELVSRKVSYLVNTLRPKVAEIATNFDAVEGRVVPGILRSGVFTEINHEHDFNATNLEVSLNVLSVQYLIDIAAGRTTLPDIPHGIRASVEETQQQITEHLGGRGTVLQKVGRFFAAPKWHIIVLYTTDGRIIGYMVGSYRARHDADEDVIKIDWLESFRLYPRIDSFINGRGDDGQDLLVSLKTLQITRERLQRTGDDSLSTNIKSRTEYGRLVPTGNALLEDIGMMARRINPSDEAKTLHVNYQHVVVDRGTA